VLSTVIEREREMCMHATLSPSFSLSLFLSHSLYLSLTGEEGAQPHTLFTGQRERERDREGERERERERERKREGETERESEKEGENCYLYF
jgi:hypothetical protein